MSAFWHDHSRVSLGLSALAVSVLLVACGGSSTKTAFPKSVTFTAPAPSGASYTEADDVDANTAGVQVNVAASASGTKEGDEFTLYLDPVTDCDGTELATAATDANQKLSFDAVTLPEGSHTLQICSADGKTTSTQVSVTVTVSVVAADCPTVTFLSPAPNGDSPITLGPADDTDGDACGTSFTTTVSVSTSAATGSDVTLYVNGSSRGSAQVSAGSANFTDVVLDNRGDTPNTIEVETTASDGHACREPFPADVLVDCSGVSCSITKPSPTSSYLNTSNDTSTNAGFQTDVEVSTDAEAVGQQVKLVVDADVGGAASADVTSQSGGGVAAFGNVQLTEGVHRFQAICTDSVGNVTYSGVVEWTVDITPCDIAITDIAGGSNPITDLDDTDTATAGIQVPASGSVTGTGCTGVRVGPCSGLPTDFTGLSGATDWSDTITLGSAASQDVCAEVQDDAGNVGQTQQTVNVRTQAPQVAIITPTDGTSFNSAGTNGSTQDLNTATAACDVAFTVNCSDVGTDVELVNQATSSVLGTATCAADSGVSAPYNGQATFTSVALPSNNAGTSLTVVARQTVGALTGLSTPITVQSDCDPPTLLLTAPACGSTLRPATDDSDTTTAGFQHDVKVANANTPKPDVTLQVLDAGGNVVNTVTSGTPATGVQTTFTNVDFGSGGQLTLSACATDAAGNTGCAPDCSVLVADLPTLAITTPADQAVLTSSADCDSVASGLQIQVTASTDAADGSAATVQISNNAVVDTTVSSGTISVCTDAPEGLALPVVVTVTDSRGTANAAVSVDVDTLPPTTAIDDLSVAFNGVGRRAGQATFSWTAVGDAGGTTLAKYALRCSATAITTEGDWTAATVVPISVLPAAAGTPQSANVSGFRITETSNCTLRGVDTGGALTPLASPASVVVASDFLQQAVTQTDGVQMGDSVTGVGDINGDGVDDVLIGSWNGPAYLYFGSKTGLSATPNVEIVGPTAGGFGRGSFALGDINGDGAPDFAVTARALNSFAGTVYVFFGKKTNTWPATVDISTSCAADLCLNGSLASALFGYRVASADFDGDGTRDLVIGAFGTNGLGRVYVILGGSQLNLSGAAKDISVPGSDLTALPDGFYIDAPTGTERFGVGLAALGDFIGADGRDDLVIGASGNPNTSTPGAVMTLAGRAYDTANSGLVAIPGTEATTFDTGPAGALGTHVESIGDYNGDGRGDVAVQVGSSAGITNVYLRTATGFTASSMVTVTNDSANSTGDLFGETYGQGLNATLGAVGDLDKDGRADLFAGSAQNGTGAGTCELFFGAAPAVSRLRSAADRSFALATARSVAAYIGDVNGDTFPDLAVGDPGDSSNKGRVVIIY